MQNTQIGQKNNLGIILFFLASFFFGMGHIALLPLFEGADETAHYSSIRQITDTLTMPITGQSYMGQDVIDYAQSAPMPYPREYPFETTRKITEKMTYRVFFQSTPDAKNYALNYREKPHNELFVKSSEENWQAQHPPLYYFMLSPIMKAVENTSFVTQFLTLRSISFILAICGLVFIFAFGKFKQDEGAPVALALYPLLVPMFFPEFARIGNDSLCTLLVAFIYVQFQKWETDEFNFKKTMGLGFLFALGLVTKAFFLAILGGFMGIILLRLWQRRNDKIHFQKRRDMIGLMLAPVFFAGFWYIYKWAAFGSFIGDTDSILFAQQHQSLWNIITNQSSLFDFVIGTLGIIVTWSWGGTGSLAKPELYLQLPLLVFMCFLFFNYICAIKKTPLTDTKWLPVWTFIPMMVGLISHAFITIGISGDFTVPGWYLNILAPLLALAMGEGWRRIEPKKYALPLLCSGLIYGMVFIICVEWSQASLYAGCADLIGRNKHFHFPDGILCLTQLSSIYQNIDLIAWPNLALVCFGSGIICGIGGVGCLIAHKRQTKADPAVIQNDSKVVLHDS